MGRPSDVYALGTILFEILAGAPLHPPGEAAIESTMSELTERSPAVRHPERNIALELDTLCVGMCVSRPERRPTARQCADQIERYLDGDRDLARRRTLANELVWKARAAYLAGQRPDAMRAASRALALDPEAVGAAELVSTLMLEPPREAPPELRAMLYQADLDDVSRHARAALPGYLIMASFLPVVIWNGVLRWPPVIAGTATALALALAAHRLMRRPGRSFAWMVLYALANAAVLVMCARAMGPLTVTPALVAFVTASVITYPAFLERPWTLLAIMLAAMLLPIALPLAGLAPAAWELRDGGLFLRADAMKLGDLSALVTIVLAGVATVVMASIQSSVLGRAKRDLQHRLVAQAWHLQQLLPR